MNLRKRKAGQKKLLKYSEFNKSVNLLQVKPSGAAEEMCLPEFGKQPTVSKTVLQIRASNGQSLPKFGF